MGGDARGRAGPRRAARQRRRYRPCPGAAAASPPIPTSRSTRPANGSSPSRNSGPAAGYRPTAVEMRRIAGVPPCPYRLARRRRRAQGRARGLRHQHLAGPVGEPGARSSPQRGPGDRLHFRRRRPSPKAERLLAEALPAAPKPRSSPGRDGEPRRDRVGDRARPASCPSTWSIRSAPATPSSPVSSRRGSTASALRNASRPGATGAAATCRHLGGFPQAPAIRLPERLRGKNRPKRVAKRPIFAGIPAFPGGFRLPSHGEWLVSRRGVKISIIRMLSCPCRVA